MLNFIGGGLGILLGLWTARRRGGNRLDLLHYATIFGILGFVTYDVDGFYYLARTAMVKDERHLDRFDQCFAHAFGGLEADHPNRCLRRRDPRGTGCARWPRSTSAPEEKAEIEALGGFDKLMETLRERLKEQQGRHQGGNKWIGTAGTSPFGAYGYNPEGVRIGQNESRHQRAVKVWDKREFRNLDDASNSARATSRWR
jgi:uncharacterized protein with von Willebrand factor type A (vWA) domain